MKPYVNKIIALIFTLFLVSVADFFIFQVIPGDPVLIILGTDGNEERREEVEHELGLDKGVVERYITWVGGALKGDFGKSYSYYRMTGERMDVSEVIGKMLPVTVWLAVVSMTILITVSLPLGILWSMVKNKYLDGILNVLNQICMAIPSFFLGLIVMYVFGIMLKTFTPGMYVGYDEDFGKFITYMIYPALAICVPKIAMTMRFLRNSLCAEEKKDYILTASAKGLSKGRIAFWHVLPNALIPVLTFLGNILAEALAGSVVVEQVFGLPGIGRLLITCIGRRDFPVVQAIILYIASAVVITYFVVDMLYRVIDPRIRRGYEEKA
ncbi:MAG: ABC transporter permease [Lachnospiraceae bacterium]|nr:ABC transporter permease [Lachnospiraceae bacterium]